MDEISSRGGGATMSFDNMADGEMQEKGNPILAMEYYEKLRKHAKKRDDIFLYCHAAGNMAKIYSSLKCYDKAVDLYRECLEKMRCPAPFALEQETLFCELSAGYGDCLVQTGHMDKAAEVAKTVEKLFLERKHGAAIELAAAVFLTIWAEKNHDKKKAEKYMNLAIQCVLENEEVIAESEQILKLIGYLIEKKQYGKLQSVLDWTEPRAAMAENESFLLQLILYRLQYCCQDMEQGEFHTNIKLFFDLKGRYEEAENKQIQQMKELRDRLKEKEEKQIRLMEENERLIYRTRHDELSGLYNKRYLSRYMEKIFEEALDKQLSLGVLFLDIDYFKQLNDRYGHHAGDSCVVAVAEVIKSCMPADFAARYGGDEFVILSVGHNRKYMEKCANKIAEKIRRKGIPNEDSPNKKMVSVTVGGVYAIPRKPNKIWDFLSAADEALYQQKEQQKGRVRFYEVQEDGL